MAIGWLHPRTVGFLIACLASSLVGVLLDLVDFPAAWLTGGLVGTAIVVSRKIEVGLPNAAVDTSYLALGALFGSAITAHIAEQMVTWAGTLILCCASLAVTMIVSTWYMRRFEGWDTPTAFFATAPGALPAVIAMSAELSLDQGRVVLSQTVRLFSLMALVPLAFSAAPPQPGTVTLVQATMSLTDLALISAVAIAGGVLARLTRMPGGLMIGALLSCGLVYATGLIDTALPMPVQNAAMMLIGMLVGVQLSGLSAAGMVRSARAVLVVLTIGVAIAVVSAVAAAELFGLPLPQLLLSYLPGAMEGMTIMGFVMGYDPAFISIHHIVRFLFVLGMLPVVSRAWRV